MEGKSRDIRNPRGTETLIVSQLPPCLDHAAVGLGSWLLFFIINSPVISFIYLLLTKNISTH